MDPYVCCLLGICCPPFSAEQFSKLVAMRLKRGGCTDKAHAEKVVTFDLSLVRGFLEMAKKGTA